jgi:single-stranded-DNA-specific exonuclease
LLSSKANWITGIADEAVVRRLNEEHGMDPLLARLLAVRGITESLQVQSLLEGEEGHFYDPFLLDGMRAAVERIRRALERREKIRIYGDYDADGVSSTALLIAVLNQLGASFDYYIPHRVNEGYGLHVEALDHAHKHGITLLITVDTGISAVEEVAYASSLGIDTIVTDHHEPPEILPDAYVLINPKKPGCPYPFKSLAGVGVAFKLAHALLGRLPEELAEITAIGTVADLMPLLDENRSLVRLGLKGMQASRYPGIRALLGLSGAEGKEVTASHIAFGLAPRINASGRLEHADDAVTLLTTTSEQEAEQLAYGLDQLNRERQRIVEEVVKEALEQVEQAAAQQRKLFVLFGHDWNVGVIGIVASKVLERYYRPTIVLSIDTETGMAKGSARSIPGFDMYAALTQCSEWLDHYGGHQAAAGMSLHSENISAFAAEMERLAEAWLSEEQLVPVIQADVECGSISEVTLEAISKLDVLAPFGHSNPAPKFVFSGLKVNELRTMGRDQQHLKLTLSDGTSRGSGSLEALLFHRGSLSGWISPTANVDVLGELSINEWNGTRRAQLVVQDIRISQVQVFDWRGSHRSNERLLKWLSLTQEQKPNGPRRITPLALLSGIRDGIREIAAAGCEVRAFGSGEDRDVTDLFVCSMPDSLEVFSRELRSYRNLERVYLLYSDSKSGEMSAAAGVSHLPSREQFKTMYQSLRQLAEWNSSDLSKLEALSRRTGLSASWIRFMIEVFEELSFVVRDGSVYRIVQVPGKRDLGESTAYRRQAARCEVEQTLLYATSQQVTDWILAQLGA